MNVFGQALSVDELWENFQKNPSSNTALPPVVFRSSYFRLLHLVSNYASLKSKAVSEGSSSSISKEHIVEKMLRCLVEMIKINKESFFWESLPHFLSVLCLSKENSSDEVRLLTLQCVHELLTKEKYLSIELSQEALEDDEFKKCLVFLTFKCFTRIHDEHPKGDQRMSKTAFNVLELLLQIFPHQQVWYGILPSATSELSAYLTQIGRCIENNDAVLSFSASSSSAVNVLSSMTALIFADTSSKLSHSPTHNQCHHTISLFLTLWDSRGHMMTTIHALLDKQKESEEEIETSILRTEAPEGSEEWFRFSLQKIVPLLRRCLPPLVKHPSPKVRAALAKGVSLLIDQCSSTLGELLMENLEILLMLSVDEYATVVETCSATFARLKLNFQTNVEISSSNVCMESLIRKGIEKFTTDLKSSEMQTFTQTKKLVAAIKLLGQSFFTTWLIEDPHLLQSLYQSLLSGYEFDPIMAKSIIQGMTHDSLPVANEDLATSSLTRIPTALHHITEQSTYQAFAKLIHTISSSLDTYGFSMFLDQCINGLRKSLYNDCEHRNLSVASVIYLLAQVVHGRGNTLLLSHNQQEAEEFCQLEKSSILILEVIKEARLWVLPTHPLKDCYENAMLLSALFKLVEAMSLFLKTKLKSSACKVMHLAFIHVLERLADPCPFVQSMAQFTIHTLYSSMNLDSLASLVVEFGDFVVDGICRQLSDLDSYPMAPYFLAAIFQEVSDAPKSLLPLLAEPAAHALQGLSIMGRASGLQYSFPFLKALMTMTACAKAEARESRKIFSEMLTHEDNQKLTAQELHSASQQMELLHASAILADGVAHLSCPLFFSDDLKACLLAFDVCLESLETLHAATAACDLHSSLTDDPLSGKNTEVQKLVPDVPKLYALIGPLWRSLTEALKSDRLPIVEKALEFLGNLAVLFEGKVLTRRFTDEAWPLLKRIINQGLLPRPPTKLVAHGASFIDYKINKDEYSLNTKLRCQKAVLLSLAKIGSDKAAKICLTAVFSDIVEQVLNLIKLPGLTPSRKEACKALEDLSLVDADYLWWKLTETEIERPDLANFFAPVYLMLSHVDVVWYERVNQIIRNS